MKSREKPQQNIMNVNGNVIGAVTPWYLFNSKIIFQHHQLMTSTNKNHTNPFVYATERKNK